MKKDDEVRRPLLEDLSSPPMDARPTGSSTEATRNLSLNRAAGSPFDQSAASTELNRGNDDSQEKKRKRYLCGLSVKKETTYWNILAMPMLPFITCTINFYAMAFIPLLLASPDYFDIDKTSLGKATAMTLIWASLLPLILTPFMTFVYEGIGRRIPVTYSLLTTNLLIWMMPKVAPNLTLLCALRAVVGFNNTLTMAAPLISDYVK